MKRGDLVLCVATTIAYSPYGSKDFVVLPGKVGILLDRPDSHFEYVSWMVDGKVGSSPSCDLQVISEC